MCKYFVLLSVLLIFTGCVKEVKPWQKAVHAKPVMKEGGPNSLLNKFEQHIYFSKEATRAGSGVQGGGCGCN